MWIDPNNFDEHIEVSFGNSCGLFRPVDKKGLTKKQLKHFNPKMVVSDDLEGLQELMSKYRIDTSKLQQKDYGEFPEHPEMYYSGIEVYNLVHTLGKPLSIVREWVKEEGWTDVNMWDYNRRIDRDKRQSRRLSNFDGNIFK